MKVRRFFRAGYALEGQPWHRLDLNAEHATDIRMEQANVRAGINQGDYVLVSVSIDKPDDEIRSSKGSQGS